METIPNLKFQYNLNSLIFEFDSFPFEIKKKITWRELNFHFKLNGFATDQKSELSIIILMNNERYLFRTLKWKQWFHTEGKLPKIKTSTHSLKIGPYKNFRSLSLTDVLLNPIGETIEEFENVFTISDAPSDIIFELPKKEEKVEEKDVVLEKNEVTLYEYKDSNVNIKSCTYFEKDDLVVDFWKLGNNYEDEFITIVKKDQLENLYKALEIEIENKAELLKGLMNAFKGKDCFEKVKGYLELKNISFENNVRHDESGY
jgi:hypothetical protein